MVTVARLLATALFTGLAGFAVWSTVRGVRPEPTRRREENSHD